MELLKRILLTGNLLSIFFPFYGICNTEGPPSSLQLVNIYFRHGNRIGIQPYPKDPYNNVSIYYPDTWGALTEKGKQHTFALGELLRRSYDGFLNKYYLPGEVIMRSSDIDRCLMSAQMVLAGLYPPKDVQKWNSRIDWQPIPVHMDPLVTVPVEDCPKFGQLIADIDTLPFVKHIDEENKELYAFLSKETGYNVTGLLQALAVNDILYSEDQNGLKLPAWTYNLYPRKLRGLLEFAVHTLAKNNDINRLGAGTAIYDLIQSMVQKKEGQLFPNYKAILHSTHDTYIELILGILGVEPVHVIQYAETLIFELHQIDTQYEIKVLNIKNAFTGETVIINLPKCTSPCTLEKFQQAFQHVATSPEDHERECH